MTGAASWPGIVVHSLGQARAALAAAAGRPVRLISPPACPALHGIGWWQALLERLRGEATGPFQAVLDCGDDGGWALAALRAGVENIAFAGEGPAKAAIKAVAEQRGAWGEARGEVGTLDLLGEIDPGEACREFLRSYRPTADR